MKVPVSWLREFVDVPADANAVATRLGECGFAVESVEDGVIDFEITANRPDCLSVYGLAREAATAFDVELKPYPDAAENLPDAADTAVRVTLEDAGCGRYALAIADVSVQASPSWLADRLSAAGVRPINNVVDISNYVMLEMGHPTHAFDVAKLAGPEIRVRRARAGERLTTLDGQTRTLDPAMLVIADRDRAVAVAGVMGGATSEVSQTTTRIVLESAWFQPTSVRATSRKLGLKTEASARFERGADIAAPVRALERALALLTQIGAGHPVATSDTYPHRAEARTVTVNHGHITRLLGESIRAEHVERILSKLGFELTRIEFGWTVVVPSFRVDVAREADLIEEVGRHWGFNKIPATFPPLRSTPRTSATSVVRERLVRRLLVGAGLQEAVTFTFIEEAVARPFAGEPTALVSIANPLSEKFAVLRPSLFPGLIDALVYSRRRESADVRLFESGTVFTPAGEARHVGWVLTGARDDHWSATHAAVDFFDAKGVADLLAEGFGTSVTAQATDEIAEFVRGRAASLFAPASSGRVAIGAIGQIQPALLSARGLGHGDEVFGGWIDLAVLEHVGALAARPIEPLPRHPSIVRDLSIIIDERLPAEKVRGTIRAHAAATLVSVREFDRYQGKGVPDGQVSLSFRLTFRDADRTLTDGEVQQSIEAIVAALAQEHGAMLRGKT